MKKYLYLITVIIFILLMNYSNAQDKIQVKDKSGKLITIKINSKTGTAHRIYNPVFDAKKYGYNNGIINKEGIRNINWNHK